jgi:hypothetical protein
VRMKRPVLTLIGVISAALLTVTGCSGSGSTTPPPAAGHGNIGDLPMATWPLPADPSANAQAAGLQMLGQEQLAVHYHVHLDIVVQGHRILIPANIGIDLRRQQITALHTHDPSGIIHIESAQNQPFTLGQFFTEWGQPLSAGQIGSVSAGGANQVQLFRNGQLVSGDPGKQRLIAHDELFLYLGPPSELPPVPRSFDFRNGL